MAGPDRRDTGVNSRAAEFRDFHTLLDFPIQAHRRLVQFQAVLLDLSPGICGCNRIAGSISNAMDMASWSGNLNWTRREKEQFLFI